MLKRFILLWWGRLVGTLVVELPVLRYKPRQSDFSARTWFVEEGDIFAFMKSSPYKSIKVKNDMIATLQLLLLTNRLVASVFLM